MDWNDAASILIEYRPALRRAMSLRSWGCSLPEEVKRVVINRNSSLQPVPSADALGRLKGEHCPTERIALVGNAMADAMLPDVEWDETPVHPRRPRSNQRRLRFGHGALHERCGGVDLPARERSIRCWLPTMRCVQTDAVDRHHLPGTEQGTIRSWILSVPRGLAKEPVPPVCNSRSPMERDY